MTIRPQAPAPQRVPDRRSDDTGAHGTGAPGTSGARSGRSEAGRRFRLRYRTVWRWHFYAGLFCLPFVLWLSLTGAVYLFKPQIEAWLERSYDHLPGLTAATPRAGAAAQVGAALAAVPGAVLAAYELPASSTGAVRVLVGRGAAVTRVFVHPATLAVLGRVDEESRPMRVLFHLHGELLLGDTGSVLVELAASWAVVLLVTGLYLWWPRGARGLAGVLYPRVERGGRVRWRDLHAVTGVWVSAFALFLIASGLPWAKSWGTVLKTVRQIGAGAPVRQDWTTGASSEHALHAAMNAQGTPAQGMVARRPMPNPADVLVEEHAGHQPAPAGRVALAGRTQAVDYRPLDRLVATVAPLRLAPPVLIAPPSQLAPRWTARSDAQNRPLRTTLVLDGATGVVLERQAFAARPLIDRVVGYGVAAHEGQLFGWVNQLLGVCTALGLVMVTTSAVMLWSRRRPTDGAVRLGAPAPLAPPPRSAALALGIIALGLLLPLLGASMLAVALVERWLLRRLPAVRDFLGLPGAA
jgi:uncharacterized iron-regulated membrane protein